MFGNIPIESITHRFWFDKKYVKQAEVWERGEGDQPEQSSDFDENLSRAQWVAWCYRLVKWLYQFPEQRHFLDTIAQWRINDTLHKTRFSSTHMFWEIFNFINLWARSHLLDDSFKLEWIFSSLPWRVFVGTEREIWDAIVDIWCLSSALFYCTPVSRIEPRGS